MKFKRLLGIALAVLIAIAVLPTAALANEIGAAAAESAKLRLLDDVWAELEAVESEVLASGAEKTDVVMAVYQAALNNPRVDKASLSDLSNKSFFFTVDGMWCAYDYVARHVDHVSSIDAELIANIEAAAAKVANTKNGPSSMNVLLVGPYYSSDGSFTDQYVNESETLAEFTGDCTQLINQYATGPAIAAAYPDCGIVIYDSHGTASGTSSYLCLTTNSGITSEDYSNGWAVSSGSAAYIDGRYIQHHVTSELPNTIVWMAICEGMKASGRGTTGYALLDAGAGCVYGYSQSVSFRGDYIYEATFWGEMMNGATVAEAFNTMTSTHGNWDPAYSSSSGSAWPIVMSPDDPFPSNPDSHQTVYCDWTIFGGNMEPVALESWSLSETTVEVVSGCTTSVTFNRIPDNANDYELVWHSYNESIATVSGNNRRVNITGVSLGGTTIYCEVLVNGTVVGTASCDVYVTYNIPLSEAAGAENSGLQFSTDPDNYPWVPVTIDGRNAAKSGNAGVSSSSSTMNLALQMSQGESISFEWKVSSENNYDYLYFYVNGAKEGNGISGTTNWATRTFTAPSDGLYIFKWSFEKDYSVNSGSDCGYVDNVVYNSLYTTGDVNNDGTVDSTDALLVLRYTMHLATLTPAQLRAADYNGDGVVDSTDAVLILRSRMNIPS